MEKVEKNAAGAFGTPGFIERGNRELDEHFMRYALKLAAQGIGTTSPNPPVGAVIVSQSGRGQDSIEPIILGEGFHEKAGQPHAERNALADARARGNESLLRGATIYVTLEPCSSYGRTPPCTEGIIEAGISRVVFGSTDPDKRHRGRAVRLLEEAGLQVTGGVLKDACDRFLRSWMHAVEQGRPWVLAKTATTMDGRLTRRAERWLSGRESLAFVHGLRVWSDAILVGGHTVRQDKPSLTIRTPDVPIPAAKDQPRRIVLTHDCSRLPTDVPLFCDAHADRTMVLENVADIKEMLQGLYREHGIVNLMLECGGHLLRRFLEEGLVDEWVQVIVPFIGGGEDMLIPGDFLPQERHFLCEQHYSLGRDIVLRGLIEHEQ